jgi:hypothetical protein
MVINCLRRILALLRVLDESVGITCNVAATGPQHLWPQVAASLRPHGDLVVASYIHQAATVPQESITKPPRCRKKASPSRHGAARKHHQAATVPQESITKPHRCRKKAATKPPQESSHQAATVPQESITKPHRCRKKAATKPPRCRRLTCCVMASWRVHRKGTMRSPLRLHGSASMKLQALVGSRRHNGGTVAASLRLHRQIWHREAAAMPRWCRVLLWSEVLGPCGSLWQLVGRTMRYQK